MDPLSEHARLTCGCFSCSGPREIGAHTLATPSRPRSTPHSCLAAVWLTHWLAMKRDEMQANAAEQHQGPAGASEGE